jgi:uncharacterized protein
VTTTHLPLSPASTEAEHRVRSVSRSVTAIAVTPVKGFALHFPQRVVLGPRGVEDNRRFLLVDAGGARLRSAVHAWPCTLRARYVPEEERLTIQFPDGAETTATARGRGAELDVEYHGNAVAARVVDGPWTERLSELAGEPVRLVRTDAAGGVQGEPVTLVSTASLERFEREAGGEVDARRFRMLFHVDGCDAHEEDAWLGRRVGIGDAVVRVVELVERCVVTTRDPASGERDLDTLHVLKRYRGSIDFGVRASVERPAPVALGDRVEPLD